MLATGSSLPSNTVILDESDPSLTPTSPPDSATAPAVQSTSEPSSLKPPIVPPPRKISAALLKASLTSLTEDPNLPFTALTSSLPVVLAQSANGVETVKRMGEFVEKLVRAKQAYAAACLAAVGEATKPLPSPTPVGESKLQPPGSRPRTGSSAGMKPRSNSTAGLVTEGEVGVRSHHAWKTLLDVVQAEGISDAAAARAYHETVATPLLEYHKELQQKHATLTEHAESMQAQLKASQERLLQTKIAVLKLVEAQQFAQERETAERDEKTRQEAAGKSGGADLVKAGKSLKTGIAFLFKSKDKQLTEALHSLTSDELRQQAFEATQGYAVAVKAANQRSDSFYDHDLPTVLRQIQMMEAQRLETIRLQMQTLSNHLKGLMGPADKRISSFTTAVNAMETRQDLEDYVTAVTSSFGGGAASRPNPFVYDLNFTAEDIRHGSVNLQPQHSSSTEVKEVRLFGSSLVQVMEGQRGSHPGVDVPWLVPMLCEIIKRGGKPVFIASVDSDEVMKGRRRLEEGEPLYSADPELAAAVLKMWLRDLDPHVISGEAYTEALEAAKAGNLSSDAVLRIFTSLPEVNQRVVQWVASTLLDVSSRDATALDNAATVLAPHLMQSPAVDASTMLSAINSGIAFVQALLLTVSTHHPVGRSGNGVSGGDLPQVEVAKLEDTALGADEEAHT